MKFTLSQKEIPDISVFDSQLRVFPEYDGLSNNMGVITIYLNVEPNETIINAIEAIIPGEPTRVFPLLTPIQLRFALVLSNISLESIYAIVEQFPEPDKTLAYVKWEYAKEYERNDAMVDTLGGLLGLTSEQIDAIWNLGATL